MCVQQKQLELGDRMDLASYLLKPVQRMGKYALLLKQILKECPETEPEYADLKVSQERCRVLVHGRTVTMGIQVISLMTEVGTAVRYLSFYSDCCETKGLSWIPSSNAGRKYI